MDGCFIDKTISLKKHYVVKLALHVGISLTIPGS